nr:hypothetical protein [uncultured Cohaesibacter sp.]
MNFDYFSPEARDAYVNLLLFPSLIIFALVAARIFFSKSHVLSFTNILFYLFLPAYIGMWLAVAGCHSREGICSIIGTGLFALFKPAAFLDLVMRAFFPPLAFALGAPAGWLVGAILRLFKRSPSISAERQRHILDR